MTHHIPDHATNSNPSIDDDAADAHQCGMTHLATGRVCHLPARHRQSCEFADAGVGGSGDAARS
jgi:hypothetical protein